jgi:hypothetical protein
MCHINFRWLDIHPRPSLHKCRPKRSELFGIMIPNVPKITGSAVIEKGQPRSFLFKQMLDVVDRPQNRNKADGAIETAAKRRRRVNVRVLRL